MKYNKQQKAEKLITYLISEASTIQSGCDIFNLCTGSICSCDYPDLLNIAGSYL
jgi:hypothetical protein